jgi:DNA polymerase IV
MDLRTRGRLNRGFFVHDSYFSKIHLVSVQKIIYQLYSIRKNRPERDAPMPLRYLFVDMNAYFASVEQHDDPKLRGRPIAVVPMIAETTCCLAASYPAKRFGVKTGMPVWQARKICPGLVTVVGRHERYVEIHKQIVKAVGRCVPVSKVMSIDEMACQLMGDEREPVNATRIAGAIKTDLRQNVGESLTCSVGVGPNVMLAKVASDMQKPDGLTMIRPEDLPGRLYELKVSDFPGIGPRMEKRFRRYGVNTTRDLVGLTERSMSTIWGSKIHGERWFHLLRGEDVPDTPTRRRTVSHSHILPPEHRQPDAARGVMIRLIHKACARLRSIAHWAGAMAVGVRYVNGERWHTARKMPHGQDTLNWLLAFGKMWDERPADAGAVLQVWMVLTDLKPAAASTPSLFEQDRQVTKLSHTMDAINRKFGKQAVRFGGLMGAEATAPVRIAFSQIPMPNPATD